MFGMIFADYKMILQAKLMVVYVWDDFCRLEDENSVPADDSVPRILFTGYPRTVVKRLTAVRIFLLF